jgi:hypothetical protein
VTLESCALLHSRLRHWLSEIEAVEVMRDDLFGWNQMAIRLTGVYELCGVRHRITAEGWDENDAEIEANFIRLAIVTQARQVPVDVDLDDPNLDLLVD